MSDPAKTSAVTVPVDLPEVAEGQQTHRYWVGVLPECPIQNVTAGGINFPLYSGPHLDGDNLIPVLKRKLGAHIDLSDEHVDLIAAAVQLRVVRMYGGGDRVGDEYEDADAEATPKKKPKKRAVMIMRDGPKCKPGYKYTALQNDVPLARFVYMHRLDQMSAEDANNFPPATMAREPEPEAVAQ